MEMIEIKGLTFAYSNGPPIFGAFNWRVQQGDAWAVIGPSGCGKTTLLYLLAGLYQPDSGSILIEGLEISGPRPRSGLVLQDHGLLPWSTVLENARLGLTIREFYGADGRHAPRDEDLQTDKADRRVRYWLEKLGIAHLHDMYPSQLSRGQRQRTAIARTLATRPDLLLLDEPFSALDAPTRDALQNLTTDLHKASGLTTIIVTHDIEVAVIMGKRILILNEGTNHHPRIVENRNAGSREYRYQTGFRDMCEDLHHILGDLL
jgi:ABC-type nitrate/sulfonate/bicarbonate transport system ATPase subunit